MSAFSRFVAAALLSSGAAVAFAGAPAVPEPERLPADTWVLLNWHGVAAANRVSGTNPVMRLWKDAQFRAARERFLETLAARNPRWARARIDDVLSVLENPLVIGIAGDPLARPAAGLLAADPRQIHLFAVLNKRGKEAEWSRLHEQVARSNLAVSVHDFRGVQVRKVVSTATARNAFEASLGSYELFSDNQALLEALITRLQERRPGGVSLRDDAVFQKAQRFRAEGPLLEMFVKVPDLLRLINVPATPQIDTAAALRELHLERIQGLWLSAGMARDRMLVRGALLGDLTPGSLLDVIGSNVAELRTPGVAPLAGTFGAIRLDLPALHAALLRAVRAGLPPDQAAAANMMVDGLVMAQIGMRLTDLLALFEGEIGGARTGDAQLARGLPNLVMIPLARGEPVLGMLRSLAGAFIRSEEQAPGGTVLSMGAPGAAGSRAQQRPPISVAVSPRLLAASPLRAQVMDVLAREATGSAAPTGSLAADATFRAARKSLPAELNGITYIDVSRLAPRGQRGARSASPSFEAAQQAYDAVFPLLNKHLKVSAGGSWKASDGWYFDAFVN